ncbi:PA containing protein [Actinomycetospora sp.]|uniref:PA containing protein n=1 Tax=Actinomycetospora sp. TaxID=1872135 RepID=UPI002F3FA694
MSFDRMRSMLVRAAEVRDSEQQQIFDSLDEIHGRLAALDALGAMRKRLAEVPDRTEMSVLAERLDETVAKLDAQESAVSSLARLVEGIVDRVSERLATPFAQLDGRLDGVAGRFEGVAGRMDGLEDRVGGLHKRLDDLDNRLDRHEMRLDQLPAAVTGPVRERLESVESSLRGQVEETSRALTETSRSLSEEISGSREAARSDAESTREQSTEQVRDLTGRLEALTERLDGMGTRVEGVENNLSGRVENVESTVSAAIEGLDSTLSGKVDGVERSLSGLTARVDGVESSLSDRVSTVASGLEASLDKLDGTLVNRPDHEAVVALVNRSNEESEHRQAGQLDEALSTFAEIILGSGGQQQQSPPPRPAARRSARKPALTSGREPSLNGHGDHAPDEEGAEA